MTQKRGAAAEDDPGGDSHVAPGGVSKVFATYYARLFPAAFHKGVGRIAYHFSGFPGWEGWLVYSELEPCRAPSDYSSRVSLHNLGESGTASKVARVARAGSFLAFLLKQARGIDLLNLYDLRPETYLAAFLYRVLNPTGTSFIKLDMDQRAVDMLLADEKTPQQRINEWLLPRCRVDFVTVETRQIEVQVRDWFELRGIPVHRVPIGFTYSGPFDIERTMGQKERLIVSVGRLGTRQKHNELLVDAICQLPAEVVAGWQVVFIGPGASQFAAWVAERTAQHPHAGAVIEVIDAIRDREELYDWCRRARVFCLTSRWESFCTVLAEALYFGCYLISTRVGAAADLTAEGADGRLVEVEDGAALAQALGEVMTASPETLEAAALRCHERVKREFDWERICRELLAAAGQPSSARPRHATACALHGSSR